MATLVATDDTYRMAEHASAHDDAPSPSHRWEAARLWHGHAARLDEIANRRVLLVPGVDEH